MSSYRVQPIYFINLTGILNCSIILAKHLIVPDYNERIAPEGAFFCLKEKPCIPAGL
jgi:hypothetical protein